MSNSTALRSVGVVVVMSTTGRGTGRSDTVEVRSAGCLLFVVSNNLLVEASISAWGGC